MHGHRAIATLIGVVGAIFGLGCSQAVRAPPPPALASAPRRVAKAPPRPDALIRQSGEAVCRTGTLAECHARGAEGDAKASNAFGARICKEGSTLECKAACDADNAAACAGLAELYKSGRLEPNEARRLDLLTRACRLGHVESCDVAATAYYALAVADRDPAPALSREGARLRTVELFRKLCEDRLEIVGTVDPRTDHRPPSDYWDIYEAAMSSSYFECAGSWARPDAPERTPTVAHERPCAFFQGTSCDMLAGVDPSSHASLAAACEADSWMACRALAREENVSREGPVYALALRKLCEHYTAAGNHTADYCGRLKDLGLGHEAAR